MDNASILARARAQRAQRSRIHRRVTQPTTTTTTPSKKLDKRPVATTGTKHQRKPNTKSKFKAKVNAPDGATPKPRAKAKRKNESDVPKPNADVSKPKADVVKAEVDVVKTPKTTPDTSLAKAKVKANVNAHAKAKVKTKVDVLLNPTTLNALYESYVELCVYNCIHNIDEPSENAYRDQISKHETYDMVDVMTQHILTLFERYTEFLNLWAQLRDETFNELMISVSQSSHISDPVSHPLLQWIMCMHFFEEMHMEDVADAKTMLEAQGLRPNNTPVVCIWCGRYCSRGPVKKMYRIKLNPNQDDLEPIAAYICQPQANVLSVVYNTLRFPQLLQSVIEDGMACMTDDMDALRMQSWPDAMVSVLGHRGTKKQLPSGVYVSACPMTDWPTKSKKGSKDAPLVHGLAQWRDMLNTCQELCNAFKVHNRNTLNISIPYNHNDT